MPVRDQRRGVQPQRNCPGRRHAYPLCAEGSRRARIARGAGRRPAYVALAYLALCTGSRWRGTRLMTVQSSSNVLLSSTPGLHDVVDAERALKRPRLPEERMLLAGCDVSEPLDSASAMPRATCATCAPRPARRSGGARDGWLVPIRSKTSRIVVNYAAALQHRGLREAPSAQSIAATLLRGPGIAHRYVCLMR